MIGKTGYDVIITGGGPTGATAGYLLSKAGLRVLIIDKSTFPRKKLCAGLITLKTVRLLERVFGESVDSLKEKGLINYESNSYEIYCRDRLVAGRTIDVPFRFIDRESYDYFLLNKARNAGAEIREGDGIGIRSIDVLKSTVSTMSGKKFSADIIIGADGVNSRVRRNFLVDLFGREDWSGNVAAAHEIFLDRDSVNKKIDHPMLFFGFTEYGYAWVFPNRKRLKIGMCGLKKKNKGDILSAFRTFLSDMRLCGTGEEKIHSYVLPYGSFLPEPVFRNVMLAGDAAGFADPLLGEGIYYAQRSAELAAQAIIERRDAMRHAPALYLELLQKYIYPELIYAGKISRVLFSYLSRLHYLPLKVLMHALGDMPVETVHGIRSYKWMRKLAEK
ncbi:MAG: geranylgeranyl reductase family protein [Nitrospirota bacterium]